MHPIQPIPANCFEKHQLTRLFPLLRIAVLTVTAALLVSCGGGDGARGAGGQTGGEGGSGGGNGGNNSDETVLGFTYKTTDALTTANDFENEVTQEGFLGFRYRSGQVFAGSPQSVYIKDNSASTRFEYRLLAPSSDINALLAQATAQGLEGYRFRGNLVFDPAGTNEVVALYTRNNGLSAAYVYEALEPDNTEDGRLTQLNFQGSRGFRFVSDFVFGGTTTRSLYARDTTVAARYVYQLLEAPVESAPFLAQLNEQGNSGSRYRGSIFLSTDSVTRSIFVSRPEQGARYAYQLESPAESADDFVSRANELGAERLLYQIDLAFGTEIQSLYVDVTQCVCQPLRLADPFTD